MALTERQKSDILGLLSGLGDAQSDERARELIDGEKEAAEFLTETQRITDALSDPGDLGDVARLSDTEASLIVDRIQDRCEAGKSAGRERRESVLPRLRFLPLGIAAVLLVALGVGYLLSDAGGSAEEPSLEIAYYQTGMQLRGPQTRKERVEPGQPIRSEREFCSFSLPNDVSVVLDQNTEVAVDQVTGPLRIAHGNVFVQAGGTMDILMADTRTHVEEGAILISASEQNLSWRVYRGKIVVHVAGLVHEMTAGQRATWNVELETLDTAPHDGRLPEWASPR